LTNINGFCQVLTQVCGHELSEQCRGFVKEIYDATLTMDQLITALLNFSQVSRAHLNREQVNLSKIAGSIISELRFTAPERQVVWHIAENITAAGDSNLLRVVLENLLGNAWKYSARANPARIEFATTQSNGETIFFVRDNGVGFPIDRADKLFHSFQRLHKSEEFEGHGIGLATVHRIIERHGGKIWVEAELDKGATFFFTLPSS
jgi:light-regulated signal transduction histidine kinase (bacteriophytochrome)